MSHRDKVLEIILKKVDEYQILILTHDRAFYNLCKRRIDNLLKKDDTYKWEFKEMYQDCTDDNDEIPIPFITDYQSHFSLAKKYFKDFDYPACANYLRKETEKILRELLPQNKTVAQSSEEGKGSVPLLLNAVIKKFEEYYSSIGGDFSPFEKLHEYKDLLMNPLSHHNIESPIYKLEIINTFEILKNLHQIRILVIEEDPENINKFLLTETDSNGEVFEYSFFLREQLLIRKDLDGQIISNNPKCWFESKRSLTNDTGFEPVSNGGGVELKFNIGYDKIMHRLGIKGKQQPKELVDIVYLEGQKLIDKLNA
jgi:hypothetical protein